MAPTERQGRVASAFAPAAISNFFEVFDKGVEAAGYSRFWKVGATGGGFVLPSGVHTKATFARDPKPIRVEVIVNGDPSYPAKTTRTALHLLLEGAGVRWGHLRLEQRVEVPVGQGFGASAASALSAVLAAASAADLSLPEDEIAYAAHAADILLQTGLGTVSSIYASTGAGVITKPGGPGVAEVREVRVPKGVKLVTASLGPYRKSRVLSSPSLKRRVNVLGRRAIRSVLRTPTLGSLCVAGERFAKKLGLESGGVVSLISTAKANGALWASQNMIGHSIHCIVEGSKTDKLVAALSTHVRKPDVRAFNFGEARARVLTHGD